MRILELNNNTVQINPECLIIPEFKKLWDRDTSKNKSVAIKEITWIYFMGDYKSIYQSYEPSLRQDIINDDIFEDKGYKPDKPVNDALKRYEEFQMTPSLRLLKSVRKAQEETSNYFDGVDWDERDKMGKPVYDITKVTNAMGTISKIVEGLDKLEERIKKEQLTDNKVRAGGTEGLLADEGF